MVKYKVAALSHRGREHVLTIKVCNEKDAGTISLESDLKPYEITIQETSNTQKKYSRKSCWVLIPI